MAWSICCNGKGMSAENARRSVPCTDPACTALTVFEWDRIAVRNGRNVCPWRPASCAASVIVIQPGSADHVLGPHHECTTCGKKESP